MSYTSNHIYRTMIHVCQLLDINLPALCFFRTRRFVTQKKTVIKFRLGILIFCARVFACVYFCVCVCVYVPISGVKLSIWFFQNLISILHSYLSALLYNFLRSVITKCWARNIGITYFGLLRNMHYISYFGRKFKLFWAIFKNIT